MIDGLKLILTGVEMRTLLEQRIGDHLHRAEHWKRELKASADQPENDPMLSEQICENQAERHKWRAAVLRFVRDHVASGEIYRLGEADLAFGELLPEAPGWLERDEAAYALVEAGARRGRDRSVSDARRRA